MKIITLNDFEELVFKYRKYSLKGERVAPILIQVPDREDFIDFQYLAKKMTEKFGSKINYANLEANAHRGKDDSHLTLGKNVLVNITVSGRHIDYFARTLILKRFSTIMTIVQIHQSLRERRHKFLMANCHGPVQILTSKDLIKEKMDKLFSK